MASVKADVDKIFNKFDHAVNIGIEIKDLTTDKVLYKKNAKRWYTPASNMKLYSTAAALVSMGPDYRFVTSLYTNAATIKNQVLQGNLYLVSQGAPDFTHHQLAQLINRLEQYNIKSIAGDIILVNQSFASKPQAPGWMVDDLDYGYGSPITPMSLDANRFDILISPGAKTGQKAIIAMPSVGGAIKVSNHVKTVADGKNCLFDYKMDKQNHLTVSGCIGLKKLAQTDSLAINNPSLYISYWLQRQLNDAGVVFKGKIKQGKLTDKAKLLASQWSQPMRDLIALTLKPSDNLFADSLFLKVGNVYFNRPATWSMAQRAVKRVLRDELGLSFSKAVLTDGSGLSRYDLISPHLTIELLQAMYQTFPISYEYLAALPLAGRDGTLAKRLTTKKSRDLVRAKTGGMKGVVSLSGYLRSLNNHILAFSIYINGIGGNSSASLGRYRWLEDKLCQYLLSLKPRGHSRNIVVKKRRLLPYEKRGTQAYRQRERTRTFNNLEFHLRKSLAGTAVAIERKPYQLVLRMNSIAKNLIAKLNKLQQHYDFWLQVQGVSAKKLTKLNTLKLFTNTRNRPKGIQLTLREQVI